MPDTHQKVNWIKIVSNLKKEIDNSEVYQRHITSDGQYFFTIHSKSGKRLAASILYEDKGEMEKVIKWLGATKGVRRRKKAVRSTPAAERTYIEQDLIYPCSDITYDIFQSGGNQRFYFVFKSKEGKVLLINGEVRGYESAEKAKEAAESVTRFAPEKESYEYRTTKNDKFYYYIKNKEGRNIARSSLFYASEDDMKASVDLLACGASLQSTAGPKSGKRVEDDYLVCEAYKGSEGFYTFEKDGEYFFSYNDANEKVFLRSEGYTTQAARDNGIESVQKNAPLPERWITGDALNGKYHYYALKAGNHQEIARSCYYEDEGSMKSAMSWVTEKFAPIIEKASSSKVQDDYLPCESYVGAEGFHTFESNGEYYFSYNNGDGTVFLRSEGYTTQAARDNGIASVQKNAPLPERWHTGEALNGKYHYYSLKAGNHQEIARSCYYDDEASMKAAMSWVTEVFNPPVVKASPGKVQDDYLPCDSYVGDEGFFKFENNGEYYFSFNSADGRVFLRSEGYTTQAARDNGIASVQKKCPSP